MDDRGWIEQGGALDVASQWACLALSGLGLALGAYALLARMLPWVPL